MERGTWEEKKTKRSGGKSPQRLSSHLSPFLSLIVGIARTCSNLPISLFISALTHSLNPTLLSDDAGDWLFGLFLLFALMEENRTHLATVAGNSFRIGFITIASNHYITKLAHTQTPHIPSARNSGFLHLPAFDYCSWGAKGRNWGGGTSKPRPCSLLFSCLLFCPNRLWSFYSFFFPSERRVGVRRCYGVFNWVSPGGKGMLIIIITGYLVWCFFFREEKRTTKIPFSGGSSRRAQIGFLFFCFPHLHPALDHFYTHGLMGTGRREREWRPR